MPNKKPLDKLLPDLPLSMNSDVDFDETSTQTVEKDTDPFQFVKEDLNEFVEDESISVVEKMSHLLVLSEFIATLAERVRDNAPEDYIFGSSEPLSLDLDDPDQDPLDDDEEDEDENEEDSDSDSDIDEELDAIFGIPLEGEVEDEATHEEDADDDSFDDDLNT